MTIKNQVAAITEHPFFKQAVKAYLEGSDKDFKHIFSELMVHTWLTVAQDCGRAFRMNKWANHPEIYAAIKDVAPPTTLYLKLPIPMPVEKPIEQPVEDPCKVIPIKRVTVKRKEPIADQLQMPFPTNNEASHDIQQEA